MLPRALDTNGRLIVIARNPKDYLVSRFFWERRGEDIDTYSKAEIERGMARMHEELLEEVEEQEIPFGAQCVPTKLHTDIVSAQRASYIVSYSWLWVRSVIASTCVRVQR